ncbi:MAG: hypothetical protein Q8O07_00605, partial [Chloroflexota bacterium]|nr:hypothetical protein [Chloroflexota bacterium]
RGAQPAGHGRRRPGALRHGWQPAPHPHDREIAASLSGKTVVMVMNKSDLPQRTAAPSDLLPGAAVVPLSALTGQG